MSKDSGKWYVVYSLSSARICYGSKEALRSLSVSRGHQVSTFRSFSKAREFAGECLRRSIAKLQFQAKMLREVKKKDLMV